jgi:hypothetical protein
LDKNCPTRSFFQKPRDIAVRAIFLPLLYEMEERVLGEEVLGEPGAKLFSPKQSSQNGNRKELKELKELKETKPLCDLCVLCGYSSATFRTHAPSKKLRDIAFPVI